VSTDHQPTDPIQQQVLAQLDVLDVEYEVIEIDPDLADTAAFCEHYGYPPETSANCILVASRSDPVAYAACVVLATTRLDVNKRVRKLMGVRKLSFASADQTRELTGMMIGGVTPFALPDDLPVYVDARVRGPASVIVGGGSRSIKIDVTPEVFARLPNATFVDDLAVEP
jgi:prolyl-tRNA editing enzyme YbaK/EbsC (Cys-tRNA(Pro) deacylase)